MWYKSTHHGRSMALLLALNIFDAVSTHAALHLGLAREGNPILSWAYSVDPDLFWLVKMVFVAGPLLIINQLDIARASVVLTLANWLYGIVACIHVLGWLSLLDR